VYLFEVGIEIGNTRCRPSISIVVTLSSFPSWNILHDKFLLVMNISLSYQVFQISLGLQEGCHLKPQSSFGQGLGTLFVIGLTYSIEAPCHSNGGCCPQLPSLRTTAFNNFGNVRLVLLLLFVVVVVVVALNRLFGVREL